MCLSDLTVACKVTSRAEAALQLSASTLKQVSAYWGPGRAYASKQQHEGWRAPAGPHKGSRKYFLRAVTGTVQPLASLGAAE
jgi:hypothetical protein